ncbi:Zn-dependent protease with chaperone function [Robbsia andropogonis]|uniref:M48 family metalloprotease n=1 Tax=Robbsia andropogonis TaxID=28092 RepID=UPI000AC09568|nr:M48 family metalloprotease [Robbsia andropogonis]MCP1117771.1 M48 family metalloprotease [Robbsia andropogonis]MCP1127236.1 M48 family metalloprotease [Robbsia andropogonis]
MTPSERTRFAALVAVSAVSALSLTLTFVASHAGASAPVLASNRSSLGMAEGSSPVQEGELAIGDPAAPLPGSAALTAGGTFGQGTRIAGAPGGPLTFRAMVPSDWLEIQGELAYEHALAIAAQQGQSLPDDNPTVVRTRAILARLEPFALKWNDRAKGWKWELSIIHSPDLDAVCLPGGKVLINDGMIERLGLNENETALLIAHLIAHALREHARSKIGEQLGQADPRVGKTGRAVAGTKALAAAPSPGARSARDPGDTSLFGSSGLAQADTRDGLPVDPADGGATPRKVSSSSRNGTHAIDANDTQRAVPGAPIIGAPGAAPVDGLALSGTSLNVVPALLNLHYEAADETEADVIGADMASRAGFDPRAGLALWEKIAAMARWKPSLPFVQEHPITDKRLADLKKRQKDMLPLYARALDASVDDLPPYRPGRWNPPRLQHSRDDDATANAPLREARHEQPATASPLSFLSSLPHRLAELFK